MLQKFGTPNFPVLERLYLEKAYDNPNGFVDQQTISNILQSCANLKSVTLSGFELSELQPDTWFAFLCKMYKTFNVFIDIFCYQNWSIDFSPAALEKYFKKTDLATF